MRSVAATAFAIVFLLVAPTFSPPEAEERDQPDQASLFDSYHLQLLLETNFVLAHQRDSLAVANPEDRDTWLHHAFGELHARHALDHTRSRVVLDHAILYVPQHAGGIGTGTAGVGSVSPSRANVVHEVYEARVTVRPSSALELTGGRQFHWDGEGLQRTNPGGLHFSVTDGLHPRAALLDAQPGFDGALLLLGPEAPLSLAFAIALQDQLAEQDVTERPLEHARYALQGWLNGDDGLRLGVSVTHQNEKMFRSGLFLKTSPGAWTIGVEGALEAYDPRERVVTMNPLFGVRGEYRGGAGHPRAGHPHAGHPGTDHPDGAWYYTFLGEYHYNGLAGIYPDEPFATPVTSDGAAGFLRPGRHYLQYGFNLGRAERWRNTNTITTNLSDPSHIAEHRLEIHAFRPATFGLGLIWTSGLSDTEFGRIAEDFVLTFSAGLQL